MMKEEEEERMIDYKQYVGSIPEEVQKNYDEHRSMLLFDLVTAKRETLPLVIVCFHLWMVSTRYNLKLKILRIDSWRVVQLLLGYLIFQLTSSSSFNAIFYCTTRIVLGVCSSVMLFVWWTANRLFPKRRVMHRAIIGSWTKRNVARHLLWEKMRIIIVAYKKYIFWYVFITGSISFILCSRWGPPSNRRSINIVKCFLKLTSFIIIHFSIFYYEEVDVVVVVVAVISQCVFRRLRINDNFFAEKLELTGLPLRWEPQRPSIQTKRH
uniref:Uncharacterized protein n=1 Tax=Glossina morsitans morsitans TaxID=37546 RepID=A0A1B0FC78_GLOMM